jgi:hypothetical protein
MWMPPKQDGADPCDVVHARLAASARLQRAGRPPMRTALHFAVLYGHVAVVDRLLRAAAATTAAAAAASEIAGADKQHVRTQVRSRENFLRHGELMMTAASLGGAPHGRRGQARQEGRSAGHDDRRRRCDVAVSNSWAPA